MNIKPSFKGIFLLLTTVVSSQIFAQSDELKKLSFKVGEWRLETTGLVVPGDPKMYQGVGYSNHYYINDSTALLDDHRFEWENGTIYRAITYRTFDPNSGRYLVVWAQAGTSNTLQIDGNWEGEIFVEKSTGKDGYGVWNDRLEVFDITENSHKAKLIRRYDSGYSLTILEYSATRIIR
ncbi:MAG: hypothetical protein ABJP45_18230 [Cyclobacteriaceae bacterium]